MTDRISKKLASIKYLTGDATNPKILDDKDGIIVHVCNDLGGWGRGFVMALSKKWKQPEKQYRDWKKGTFGEDFPAFTLGNVQIIKVEDGIYVANMIAQHGVAPIQGIPPIRYDRVWQCLNKVASIAKKLDANVHMPNLIGCGLAGGHKKTIIEIIEETLIAKNINVYIYTLPEEKASNPPPSLSPPPIMEVVFERSK